MRTIAWSLLLVYAFAIPWEYSLDLGSSLGNIARFVGLLILLTAIPAILQARCLRSTGLIGLLALVLFLWFCCTSFWTIEPLVTFEKLRGFAQEMMAVWLIWEFAESPQDLRSLLRAFIAGAWVLALLTLLTFTSAADLGRGQIRFASPGQDPNDVARFLDLSFPLAALLVNCELRWPARLLALGYFPLGLTAVLLTASRGGFMACLVALLGCALLLVRSHPKSVLACALSLPALAAALWLAIPRETFERLATIPEQLGGGDLNQRLNIWHAGWSAFAAAPLLGTGVGSFVSATGMSPQDTAHNTVLSILVASGLVGLFLVSCLIAAALKAALDTGPPVSIALIAAMVVWTIASMVSTLEESRATWFLLGIVAFSGRLAAEQPEALGECFSAAGPPLPDAVFKPLAGGSAS